jgi:iron complex outermembrane receptor protein
VIRARYSIYKSAIFDRKNTVFASCERLIISSICARLVPAVTIVTVAGDQKFRTATRFKSGAPPNMNVNLSCGRSTAREIHVCSYRLFALTIASSPLFALAPVTLAQTTDAVDSEALDNIVVTGTRVQDRSRLDTLAPVDVLPEATLSEQGTTELSEALSTVAPSVNFPRPAVTDGTDTIRPATLRGLAPDQTLVLVNSKRKNQSALVNVNSSVGRGSSAVDFNTIPLIAVERVEVLRDGASAQYGSDAIAGVVNVRLRAAREGGGTTVTYGQYESEVDTARTSYDKSDGETTTVGVWKGLPLGAKGFLTLSGEYRDREPTARGDLDPRLANPTAASMLPPRTPIITSRYGDAEVQDATVYVNAGLPLGESGLEVYGWAGYQDRDGEAAATPRTFFNENNDPAVFPNGFLPIITTDVKDYNAAAGIRGPIGGGWAGDASVVFGRNELDYGVENTLNGSLVPNSPTSFDAGGIEYDQLVLNLQATRGIDIGLAAPANLAIGFEGRRETYGINAGEVASFVQGPRTGPNIARGAQGFPGFSPDNEVDEDRTAAGLYVDLEAQLTDKLLGSVAARAEDYSDFGSAVTGKLSARYDFTQSFALRGTASTGFRAPGIQQQFFASTATNFINGVPFQVGTLPVDSPTAKALGAKPLKEEESENFSVGAVFRTGGFEATLDAYRIKIDDRIVLSENLGIGLADVGALLAPAGLGGARFFINGVNTTTEGIDLVLRYGFRMGDAGDLDLTASANYNDTEVTRVPQTGQLAPQLSSTPAIFDRANQIAFEEGTPESKVVIAANWSRSFVFGSLGFGTKATRYGKVTDPGTPANGSQAFELSAKTLVDLELRAKFGESFSVGIGADNVFDQYVDKTPAGFNTNGLTAFSRFAPFGFNGRFIYGRLGWKF